jgi:hypothetical protein
MDLTLHTGLVISNNDPEKKGRVQIRILPEFKDVDESTLPWAIPFNLTSSLTSIEKTTYEVNSLVWVLIDSLWLRYYYLNNRFFHSFFDFADIESKLNIITENPSKEYKDLRFTLYEDGSLNFHNIVTGETGFIHKQGTYIYFDSNGVLNINGSTKNLVTHAELSLALSGLMTSLNTHVHQVVSLGAPTLPTPTSTPPTNFSIDISNAKTDRIKTT